MRRVLALIAFAGTSAWIACSTYGEEGVTPEPTTPEADSSTDASVQDASSEEASSGRYCSTLRPSASFCADFDEPPTALEDWDETFIAADAGLQRDDARSKSPPRSLHGTSSGNNVAFYRRQFKGVTKKLTIELDVFVAGPLPASDAALAAVKVTTTGQKAVALFAQNSGMYFQEGTTHLSAKDATLPNAWRHAVLVFDLEGTAPTVSARIEGTDLWVNEPLTSEWSKPAAIVLDVGAVIPFKIPNTGDAWVDNVVVRIE